MVFDSFKKTDGVFGHFSFKRFLKKEHDHPKKNNITKKHIKTYRKGVPNGVKIGTPWKVKISNLPVLDVQGFALPAAAAAALLERYCHLASFEQSSRGPRLFVLYRGLYYPVI